MRVLGIDPGVAKMGYAVVERRGAKLRPLALGVLMTPSDSSLGDRLVALQSGVAGVIAEHEPDIVALERLFFTANVKTAMSVGQASGVALAEVARAGIEAVYYTPNEVKQSVVGYGGASKAQIQTMVTALLRLDSTPRPPDAADACALAICHLNRSGLTQAIRSAAR